MLERESTRLGVSAAQFVREATIIRLATLAGSRGDPDAELAIADIAAQAKGRARPDDLAKALAEPGAACRAPRRRPARQRARGAV